MEVLTEDSVMESNPKAIPEFDLIIEIKNSMSLEA